MITTAATPEQSQVAAALMGTVRTLRSDIKEAQARPKEATTLLDQGFIPGTSIGATARLLGNTAQDIESGTSRLHALLLSVGLVGLTAEDVTAILTAE